MTRVQWDEEKPKLVGDIINRIPGVFWNDLGNEQHSMSIRQPISTNAVYQYLEDGIPIRPLGVFNHNALNENNMNAASGVEVVKGAASSLYGSNAVGGAVNFLTQRASKRRRLIWEFGLMIRMALPGLTQAPATRGAI